MRQKSTKNERFTSIASTLVAVAILAAGVTAQQSRQAPHEELTRLESDLRFQLERAFKHDGSRRDETMAQVDQVVQSWQASPQSGNDRALFATWLTEATTHAMPGAHKTLPLAPEFGQPEQAMPLAVVQPTEVAPALIEPTTNDSAPTIAVDVTDEVASTSLSNTTELFKQPTATAASPHISLLAADPLKLNLETPTPNAPAQFSQISNRPVPINLTELTARITGYHHGLDDVETQLRTTNLPSFEILAREVHQLEEMAKDFRFVKLYYDSLTERERRFVSSPRSMGGMLAEIYRHVDRLEQTQDDDFLSVFDSAQNEQIDHLRMRLSAVAERITP